MPLSCFVISRIGEQDSQARKHADEVLEFIITPALKDLVYDKPIRADQIAIPGSITVQLIELLISSDLVIADLTGLNANVFYELAIRHACNKPVIQLLHEEEKLPFDIQDMRKIEYGLGARSASIAASKIREQVQSILDGAITSSPVKLALLHAGLTDSQDRTQEALAQIIREVNNLGSDIKQTVKYMRNNEANQKIAAVAAYVEKYKHPVHEFSQRVMNDLSIRDIKDFYDCLDKENQETFIEKLKTTVQRNITRVDG